EVAMRVLGLEQRRDRLPVLEVLLEAAVRLRLLAASRHDEALLAQLTPDQVAELERLGEPLDQDVGRAADRRLGVGEALLLVAERERPELERLAGLRRLGAVAAAPDPVGEGLEAGGARDGGAALALPLVRKVEVLERVAVERRDHLLAQLGRELLLALDLLEDERLARQDRVPFLARVEHGADRDLVEVAGALLPVARDERDGRAVRGEREHGLRRRRPDLRHLQSEKALEIHVGEMGLRRRVPYGSARAARGPCTGAAARPPLPGMPRLRGFFQGVGRTAAAIGGTRPIRERERPLGRSDRRRDRG